MWIDASDVYLFLCVQTYLMMVVPESAVATLYICFAEDPETLRKHDPACHQYMDERRRQLEQSIAE